MKKTIFYVICFLLCMNLLGHAGESLKIFAPPSIWAQKQGKSLSGPIIDLVAEVFAEFNVSITTTIQPWARAIENMKTGELDMIPVIFYTEERSKFMAFTIPYVEVPTSVFVPKGMSFPFSMLEDLMGKRGLMMRNDSISSEFSEFESKLNIVKVVNYEQIFNMLDDHRADYAVAAQYGFRIYAKKLGFEDKIDLLPKPIASRNLHFAFSKKSPFKKYLPLVNKKIKQLQADGRMEKMVIKAIEKAASN